MDVRAKDLMKTLPSVAFHERNLLPDTCAIYFALTEDGCVLYVGQSLHLRQRWIGHHRLHDIGHAGCARIAWHTCTPLELFHTEHVAIQTYQPLLNIAATTQKQRRRELCLTGGVRARAIIRHDHVFMSSGNIKHFLCALHGCRNHGNHEACASCGFPEDEHPFEF